jgi:hypothetical protein
MLNQLQNPGIRFILYVKRANSLQFTVYRGWGRKETGFYRSYLTPFIPLSFGGRVKERGKKFERGLRPLSLRTPLS